MKYLICNLKATKIKEEIIDYEKKLAAFNNSTEIELIICPSTLYLPFFKNKNYKLGSQDISKFRLGPYTGEVTAEQLFSLNVKYTLIGHSDRRKFDNEQTLIEKIQNAFDNDIKPILFIGENEVTEDADKILESQITKILNKIPENKRMNIVLVYEPVWAIGSGMIATNQQISTRIKNLKKILIEKYNLNLPILYGGSVNELNINSLKKIDILDGFVLGESSRNFEELSKIYEKLKK